MITMVNGYVCYNCTDVDNAKKGLNPAPPNKDDPLSRQAKTQSEVGPPGKSADTPALILSGALPDAANGNSSLSPSDDTNQSPFAASYASTTGTNLEFRYNERTYRPLGFDHPQFRRFARIST